MVVASCTGPLSRVLAGAGCGCGGEGGLAGVGPPDAGVNPSADDEGGLFLVVGEQLGLEVAKVDAPAFTVCGCDALLGSLPCSTQLAEGDRVAAGLRGEVAAKPESVSPLAE